MRLIWFAKLLGLLLAGVAGCFVYFYGDYAFGVREAAHPELFDGVPGLNNAMKWDRERSWLTEVRVGSDVVEIEHLTVTDWGDVRRLKLPWGNYLFTSVRIPSANTSVEELALVHEGNPLEAVGTYVFTGVPGRAWDIEPASTSTAPGRIPHGFIRVYKMPDGARAIGAVTRRWWFPNPMHQRIRLREHSDGATHELRFDLEWHQRGSFVWQLLMGT